MRCKTCDYRLWNLPARRCPECGTPFAPSTYEFTPGTVQFCCPHCNQAYYGTGPKGHLVPPAFDCVSCGQHVALDEMVLRPTAGLAEEQTKVARVPWLERRERGWVNAWLATVGMALASPLRLMRMSPTGGSSGPAWGFAALTIFLVMAAALIPLAVFPLLFAFGLRAGPSVFVVPLMFAATAVGMALAMLVLIALWAWVTHGLLRLLARPVAGIRRTCQAIGYSSGANVVTALPCLGLYFGWIWWLASAVLMVKEGQQVRGGRAALAVLPFPLLIITSVIGLYAWGIVASLSASKASAAASAQARTTETQTVVNAVLEFAKKNAGRGPDHAAQLVTEGYLPAATLIGSSSMSAAAQVSVGTATLDDIGSLPADDALAAVQAAIAALPKDATAHRLGDFVFVYRGIDLETADPQLWIVIRALDPAPNGPPLGFETFTMGCVDGSAVEAPPGTLAARLAKQNALRAKNDLPPLPDPTTVAHSRSALPE